MPASSTFLAADMAPMCTAPLVAFACVAFAGAGAGAVLLVAPLLKLKPRLMPFTLSATDNGRDSPSSSVLIAHGATLLTGAVRAATLRLGTNLGASLPLLDAFGSTFVASTFGCISVDFAVTVVGREGDRAAVRAAAGRAVCGSTGWSAGGVGGGAGGFADTSVGGATWVVGVGVVGED